MGVIKNGYLMGISGRVDNVVVSRWKGIDVLRGLPDFRDTTPTENQIVARNRFKCMIEFCKMMKYPVVRNIWNGLSNKMTGANLFVKANAEAFNEEGVIEDYSMLKLAKGDLEAPTGLTICNDGTGDKSLILKWTFNELYAPNAAEDMLNLIIFKKGDSNKHPRLMYNFSMRNEKTSELMVDEYEEGDELNIFVFHSRDKFKIFSNSVYNKVVLDFSKASE